jgi:hypothetical protein
MDRYDPDRPSIFSRPADDDLDAAPSEPPPVRATRPGQEARGPIRPRPPGEFDAPRRASASEGLSRQVIVFGSMGLAILALSGFIAFSLLRPDAEPTVAAVPSATASTAAVPSAEPSEAATAEPTASPIPTPEPTPAGPPAELAVGGWATVTVDELNVRRDAGPDEASVYRLVEGAVVHVADGPTVIGGGNWYRVASLGGATGWASSGWEADPYLETVTGDPTLSECGQVRRAVFDVVGGSATPHDPLRVGDYALPAAAFQDASLGAIELVRGMGDEMCFTARLGADGLPEMSTAVAVGACGHVEAEGSILRLEPTDDDSVPLASQVMESTIVHPALLDGGPADNRMSSNIRTVVGMMANDGTSGCLSVNVTQRGDAIESYRSVNVSQCSTVSLYDEFSLKLAPASGGPTAWIKLTAENFQVGQFPLGQPVQVTVDAGAGDRGRQVYAWRGNDPDCG